MRDCVSWGSGVFKKMGSRDKSGFVVLFTTAAFLCYNM